VPDGSGTAHTQMKTLQFALVLCLALVAIPIPPAFAQSTEAKVPVGILPTHDATGESYGGVFTRALPEMIFVELEKSRGQPIFLNPGGAYSPIDEDWYPEYARTMKVDVVLVTSLVGRARRSGTLRVEGFLLNVRTKARSPKLMATASIDKKDLDVAYYFEGASFFGANRVFDKTRMGKAAHKLADSLAAAVVANASALVDGGSVPVATPPSGACDVAVRVRYVEKGSASKNYVLIVNGREESLGTVDGVARMRLPAGKVVTHVSVRDAPYRLPVQDSYSANTVLDCSRPERTLALEIGPVGEAALRWSP